MSPDTIEEIAKLMVGEHVGWQARFADAVGISRSHLSNVLKCSRPVTTLLTIRIYVGCIEQSVTLDRRSKDLARVAAELKAILPRGVSPDSYSLKYHLAEATEAETIRKDMTGWSNEGEES